MHKCFFDIFQIQTQFSASSVSILRLTILRHSKHLFQGYVVYLSENSINIVYESFEFF